MTLVRCDDPSVLSGLAEEARREGFRFLDRLQTEWANRSNRFDALGETLLVALVGGQAVAVGGVSRQRPGLARLRRVYVSPAIRRAGIGTRLVSRLVEHAREGFEEIVLWTDEADAARLYERLGFVPQDPGDPDWATHRLRVESP